MSKNEAHLTVTTKRGSLICMIAGLISRLIVRGTIYGYAFMYFYTGIAKLLHIEAFIRGNRKIPFLGQYAEQIGWGILSLEIVLAVLLIIPLYKIKRISLIASTLLMGIFTLYLVLMVAFVEDKLCHCGGVIAAMGWKTHIAFNLFWLTMGIYALKKTKIINT